MNIEPETKLIALSNIAAGICANSDTDTAKSKPIAEMSQRILDALLDQLEKNHYEPRPSQF